ncbi:hypothetical protein I8G32_01391 [Rhodopseudomonas palustris]|uniref:Uncharacterized protein n=2 Tax=Rhodopseudomonas palustris TaxID=1076 RepID=Q6NA26_RHOPA|nr:hypothetical protein [Rhodopseudomonas palustris]OPF91845.1 hypothetical protein B1S06_18085 [Rhodopseudomonas palustris]QQM02856.1 hypothetical protein I8G32_01391 [Rhodopseudomonas palustris]WAB79032.1 hypothetical protein OR798_06990 [Rhodopseudomonas palustris]WCL91495.1 hypothetical protein TX73_006985 [Rhodopseudomonas palustris CGA009]WND52930.1 hypothetical protein L1A21_06960 [Rhodopseudomonas palustris]
MMDTEWRRNLGTVGAEARAGKITSLALVASLAVVSGLGAASSASAQSQPPPPAAAQSSQGSSRLPAVTIESPPVSPLLPAAPTSAPPPLDLSAAATRGAGQGTHERCVDVTIGNDHSLGCVNERLKRKVDQVNPIMNVPPIDAKSSDLKVGTVNIPAVQQQYGSNFGISVMPYRPNLSFPSPRGR